MNAPVTPWHASPLCQQLIADMFALEDVAYRYRQFAREAGDKYPESDETAREIGSLEQGWKLPSRYAADGLIGKLLDRLQGARDQWIEDEVFRVGDARGLSRAWNAPEADQDAWEVLWTETTDAADTVDQAIYLAVLAFNERAAA